MGTLVAPLRHRDFRLLWTGMTISLLGDGMFVVALAWQVYELSNGPAALAVVGLAMSLPQVAFLLIGGVVSDRFDRRRVMIAADAVRGVALALLGWLALTGALHMWQVIAIAALYGSGTAFFLPAFDAIVPQLVPSQSLDQANSLNQLVRPAAWQLAGPALGGLVIAAWSAGGAFLLDALTFACSIAALALMQPAPAPAGNDRAGEQGLVGDLLEAFRYVRTRTWLWGTFAAATVTYLLFLGPTEVLLPFVVKNRMHGTASDLGLILAMGGVGAIGAAILLGRRGVPRRQMTFIYTAWTLSTLAVAGYGLATAPWQAMVAAFTFAGLETAGLIAWATTKQRLVPGRLLGRVSSLDWFISICLLPLSFALTGPVAAAVGPETTLVGAGLLGAAVTFAFLFLPGVRDVERPGLADRAGADLASDSFQIGEGPSPEPVAAVGRPAGGRDGDRDSAP